jgi:hypothetical protein
VLSETRLLIILSASTKARVIQTGVNPVLKGEVEMTRLLQFTATTSLLPVISTVAVAQSKDRHTFLLTLNLLCIEDATGSPLSPIVVF